MSEIRSGQQGNSRRQFLSYLAASSLITPPAFGQQLSTDAQRQDYARIYGTDSVPLRDLSALRDYQEGRIARPPSLQALSDAIDHDLAVRLVQTSRHSELAMLLLWNGFALDATSVDHTTGSSLAPLATYGAQLGPGRSSRALAIIHLAMFEAVNAIVRRYASYQGIQASMLANLDLTPDQISPATASVSRAITEAAFKTLVALYPAQEAIFSLQRAKVLPVKAASDSAETLGARLGMEAARLVLANRQNDGSELTDAPAADYTSGNAMVWQQDPISLGKTALGAGWARVLPFAVSSADQFRPAPPPSLGSDEFNAAYKSVKRLGGDACAPTEDPRWPTPTVRTGTDCTEADRLTTNLDDDNETFKALFWAYDGVPMLCAPPRLYNMVATSIALKEKPIHKVEEMARYLALINLAMSDAGVCAWDAKYHFAVARPVTAIRGMSADGTTEGAQDPKWTPLGAPVTNGKLGSRNLTPPFPAYPSGHATFGGALFETMRLFWGLSTEGVPFHFVSDEFNGMNPGPGDAVPRPRVNRHFASFAQAELENAQSRIWLGIHWPFDADRGIEMGRKVARDVYANVLRELPG